MKDGELEEYMLSCICAVTPDDDGIFTFHIILATHSAIQYIVCRFTIFCVLQFMFFYFFWNVISLYAYMLSLRMFVCSGSIVFRLVYSIHALD